jgi:TonB family protein
MRTIGRCWVVGAALATALGCGGGSSGGGAAAPAPADEGGGDADDDGLIPEEKYDEIEGVFQHKSSVVARCYAEAVETGDVDKAEKGHVTVAVTVTTSGGASNVKILESSFGSPKVGECVVGLVSQWTFTDALPKPLDVSHTYVLDRF